MRLFTQQEYCDQTFEALDAKGTKVEGRHFDHCFFHSCRFNEAQLVHCRFVDCQFVNCDLSNAKLTGSAFRSVLFDSCKLLGILWTDAASLHPFCALKSVLDYSSFVGIKLKKCRIESCQVRQADLSGADLSEGFCQGCDFSGSQFLGTNLTKADFRGATHYAISPRDNIVKKARFSLPEAMSLVYGLDIRLDDE